MPGRDAELHETHVGVVLLLGERAYKVKKPVDLGFVDFTDVEHRRHACQREVELNRRMSPDEYVGVAELHDPEGGSEPVVVMRRMSAEERLSTLVATHADVLPPLRELAKQLASLHARSPHGAPIDAEGTRDRLRDRWSASFDQVRPFHDSLLAGTAVEECERLVHQFLAGRGPLFEERVATGCVVDGHGDLIADDVYCTPRGPRALDCLEFDDRLRYVDGIDDAAFLAMDLERLGARGAAEHFLECYRDYSGDTAPDSLVHHFVAYRAFVRAKVACLQQAPGRAGPAPAAVRLVEMTHEHLAAHEVILVLVGGPPGTGKSTVSAGLADRAGLVRLESDRLRKELAGLAPEARAAAPWRTGLYDAASTEQTYEELMRRAGALLGRGESVVLDASWTDARHRAGARQVAHSAHSPVLEISCTCDASLAAARLTGRGGNASDADADIARHLRATTSPWPEAHALETSGDLVATLEQAAGWLPAARRVRPRGRSRIVPD